MLPWKAALSRQLTLLGLLSGILCGAAGTPKPRVLFSDSLASHLGAPSADGGYLTVVDPDSGNLAVRFFASGKTRLLTANRGPAEFAYFSVPSPDGGSVAYAWLNAEKFYELRIVSSGGGEPRILLRNEETGFVQPCAWTPDGKRILTLLFRSDNISQIALVPAAGAAPQILKSLNWIYPNKMDLSPGGDWIAYDNAARPDSPQRDIFLLAADGSREVRLIQHPANDVFPLFTRDGRGLLFLSDRSGANGLWHQALDRDRPSGDPVLVAPDLGRALPMGLTNDGRYVFARRSGSSNLALANLDPKSRAPSSKVRLLGRGVDTGDSSPAWSPDGRTLAWLTRIGTENFGLESRGVTFYSLDTGEARLVTPKLAYIDLLRWSPDGRALLAGGSDRHGQRGLYLVDPLSGEVRPLVRRRDSGYRGFDAAWLGPGLIVYIQEGEQYEIRARPVAYGEERTLYAARARLSRLAVSPVSKQIAFLSQSAPDHPQLVLVIHESGGAPRQFASVRQGRLDGIGWLDKDELLLTGSSAAGAVFFRVPAAGGSPERLAWKLDARGPVSVSPSGEMVAFTTGQPRTEILVLENFLPQEK